jgi:hypothetical protein
MTVPAEGVPGEVRGMAGGVQISHLHADSRVCPVDRFDVGRIRSRESLRATGLRRTRPSLRPPSLAVDG